MIANLPIDYQNLYSTKDLFEASFLYAVGCKFVGLKTEDKRIYYFLFENKNECEKLIVNFWNKSAQVSAKEYADAIRTLKDMIYKERK